MEMVVSKIRYGSFDGLRAIAAFCIVMMHVRANMPVKPDGALIYSIIASFSSFVYLFMMLSAFSLCCGYYNKFTVKDGSCSFDVDKFYNKRYARIWPFFFILVSIECLMDHSLESLYHSFADLTLVFHLLPNPSLKVIGMGWFLGVIFLFYIMFPFFVYLLHSKKRAWLALTVAIVFQLIGYNYFLTNPTFVVSPVFKRQIIFCLPYFMVGGLLYLYKDKLSSWGGYYKMMFVLATLSYVLYFTPFKPVIWNDEYLYLTIVYALLILYALTDSVRINKIKEATGVYPWSFLDNKIMRFVSNISMEIYLCHMMMFRVVEKLHLEKHIENADISFVIHFLITFSLALSFAWFVKCVLFNYLSKRFPSLSFLV